MNQIAFPSEVARRVSPRNDFEVFPSSEVEQSIAARFEKQVLRHGERLAIRTAGHELTYRALNKLANRLAHAIHKRKSATPAAVALLLEHDAPLLAAILAVLKAGHFYVVLDPSYPADRMRNILDDCETDLLITEAKYLPRAREIASPRCAVLSADAIEPEFSDENLDLATPPSALAYIIYTSGSTGKAKGVCQTQRNVLHNTRKYTNACHLSAQDRFSLLALCSFSASVSNLFGALLNGAALLPFEIKKEGVSNLLRWLREEEISIYHSVPLVFRNLAQTIGDGQGFPKLRLIKLGGEAITRGDFDLFKEHFADHALLYIGLGASEMNCIRSWLLDRESEFSGPVAPVGYAVEETDVLLLDQDQREVPMGEIGEIAVRSPYLFPGYWRRPELTEAAFIPDADGGTDRIFRTGDSGQMLPGGLLLHLGRNEYQIKIRGARVEPAEIESVLRRQPEVSNCLVIARGAAEEKHLVAYLTNGRGHKPDASILRNRLSEKLPDYMVPARFVWLDEMPLTNGKIDRIALQHLDEEADAASNQNYVAPRNDLERQLVEIWQRVLRHERIGVRDNFFELGGHSLAAGLIAVEIEQMLGCQVPISTLFWATTIESLGNHLQDCSPPLSSLVPLQSAGTKPPLFIVHGWGGDVHFYRELTKLLPDQPAYGLQAVGLDGKRPRHISVEEMAAHYVAEICAQPGSGPYRLIGYSLGSLIAFEMARQLGQRGERVAFLGLLDPPMRPAPWWPYARTLAPLLWQSGRFHLGRWLRSAGRESVHLKRRWRRLLRWIEKNQSNPPVILSAPQCSSAPPQIAGYRDYYSAVASAYRLRHYPGAIDLIVSDSLPKVLLPLWGFLAKQGARLHRISCTHRQMIEREHLPAVARALSAALERAGVEPTSPRPEDGSSIMPSLLPAAAAGCVVTANKRNMK